MDRKEKELSWHASTKAQRSRNATGTAFARAGTASLGVRVFLQIKKIPCIGRTLMNPENEREREWERRVRARSLGERESRGEERKDQDGRAGVKV